MGSVYAISSRILSFPTILAESLRNANTHLPRTPSVTKRHATSNMHFNVQASRRNSNTRGSVISGPLSQLCRDLVPSRP